MDKEAIEKIKKFVRAVSENGCPPGGECENYKVDDILITHGNKIKWQFGMM